MTLYEIFYSYQKIFEIYQKDLEHIIPDYNYKNKILSLLVQLESFHEDTRKHGLKIYNNLSSIELRKFHKDFCKLYCFDDEVLVYQSDFPALKNAEIDRNNLDGFFLNDLLKEMDLLERLFLSDNENNGPMSDFELPIRITIDGSIYLNIHQAKTFYANFDSLPEESQIFSLKEHNFSITIPDLHGYLIKLLYSLMVSGIISCSGKTFRGIKKCLHAIDNYSDNFFIINDLADLQSVYGDEKKERHNLSELASVLTTNIRESLFQLNELIGEIDVIAEGKVLIRFLGDMLADRQGCCVDILQILSYLSQVAPMEIIFSNHDLQFYKYMKLSSEEKNRFINYFMRDPSLRKTYESLIRYHFLFYLNPEMQDVVKEFEDAYKNFYMKNIRLLSYEIKENGEIVIFSHAPFTIRSILFSAIELGVDEKLIDNASKILCEKSIHKRSAILAELIDAMNLQFKDKLISSDLTNFFQNTQSTSELYHARKLKVTLYDFNVFMSGVTSVHGHLGERTAEIDFSSYIEKDYHASFMQRMINLDTEIGKSRVDKEGGISLYFGETAKEPKEALKHIDDILTGSINPFRAYFMGKSI